MLSTPVDVCHAETGGISNVVELLAAKFSSRNCCAGRERKKCFRRDVAAVERVDSDAIARITRFLTKRIGEGRHRSVETVAVEAEGKSEEICLVASGPRRSSGNRSARWFRD